MTTISPPGSAIRPPQLSEIIPVRRGADDLDFLRRYLEIAPASLALVRAIECRHLAGIPMRRPVLDLGCGDGVLGQVLFAEPIDLGIDASAHELAIARASGGYRRLILADGAALPCADESFETVISNGVLEHVEDLTGALREIARVLRHGGRLVFSVPGTGEHEHLAGSVALRRPGLTGLARRYVDLFNRVFGHRNFFDWTGWRDRLDAAGLELIWHLHYNPVQVLVVHELLLPAALPAVASKRWLKRWIALPGPRRWLAPHLARLLAPPYRTPVGRGATILMIARRPIDGRGEPEQDMIGREPAGDEESPSSPARPG